MTRKPCNLSQKRSGLSESLQLTSSIEKLQTIKSKLFETIDAKRNSKTIQGQYRFQSNKVYKEKLKKIFHPLTMEEYSDIISFQKYFDRYVNQSNKIQEVIETNQPYMNQTIQKMTKKDIFEVILTLNVDQLCELSCMKPEKLLENKLITSVQARQVNCKKLPKILKRNMSKKTRFNESPIMMSPLSKKYSIDSPKNPLKRTNEPYETQGSIRSSKMSMKYRQSLDRSENTVNPNKLIDRLNQINGTNHQANNFRMKQQIFRQFLIQRHGNEIISNYFDLPQTLTAANISETLKSIYNSTTRQKLMMAFLTFDKNKDGFICQRDLFQVSKHIDQSSTINKDIEKIITFCKISDYQIPLQSHLPKEFYQNPKRKVYWLFFEKDSNQQSQKKVKLHELAQKVQYFTIGKIDSGRERFSYVTNLNERKNFFKVNFKMFEQIFSQSKCELIEDLIQTFVREESLVYRGSLKVNRKITLKDAKFCSQTLELRRSNKSVEVRPLKKGVKGEAKRSQIKFQNLRANTEGTSLQKIIQTNLGKTNPQLKTILVDFLQKNHSKVRNENNENEETNLDTKSLVFDQKLEKITHHKQKSKNGYILPKEVIDKLKVFRTDRSKFQMAHSLLKSSYFQYE